MKLHAGKTVINNCRLFDGTGSAAKESQALHYEDGIITYVGVIMHGAGLIADSRGPRITMFGAALIFAAGYQLMYQCLSDCHFAAVP